jgi:organic hydroperoxide reductase OsmC/OhrA
MKDVTSTRTHQYRASCTWEGSTGLGYDRYSRAHTAAASSATARLVMSSDPAFLGSSELLNPEQLLLIAASSCQLLSFLAVAARARVDVIAHEDNSEASMPEDDLPVRLTDIWLRPQITVRVPATEQRIRELTEVAHRECFIANSLRCRIVIQPKVQIVTAD